MLTLLSTLYFGDCNFNSFCRSYLRAEKGHLLRIRVWLKVVLSDALSLCDPWCLSGALGDGRAWKREKGRVPQVSKQSRRGTNEDAKMAGGKSAICSGVLQGEMKCSGRGK